jgi:hypothetical protein
MNRKWIAGAIAVTTLLTFAVAGSLAVTSDGEAAPVSCVSLVMEDLAAWSRPDFDFATHELTQETPSANCEKDGSVLPGDHHPTKAGITPPAPGTVARDRP